MLKRGGSEAHGGMPVPDTDSTPRGMRHPHPLHLDRGEAPFCKCQRWQGAEYLIPYVDGLHLGGNGHSRGLVSAGASAGAGASVGSNVQVSMQGNSTATLCAATAGYPALVAAIQSLRRALSSSSSFDFSSSSSSAHAVARFLRQHQRDNEPVQGQYL